MGFLRKLINLKLEVVKSHLLNPENLIGYNEEISNTFMDNKKNFNQFESKKYKSSKLANTKGKSELKRNAKKSKLSDKRKKSKKK